jgi:hypothetical protein
MLIGLCFRTDMLLLSKISFLQYVVGKIVVSADTIIFYDS